MIKHTETERYILIYFNVSSHHTIVHTSRTLPCESKDLQKFVQKPGCYLLEDAWLGHSVLKTQVKDVSVKNVSTSFKKKKK